MTKWSTNTSKLRIDDLYNVLSTEFQLIIHESDQARITECANFLNGFLESKSKSVYGVNTGFGSLCNISIPNEDIEALQQNLIRSHACGTGDEVPSEIIRLMLFLKIMSLKQGYSGVQLETVMRLSHFLNQNILPVIYQQGSLGASGDLAPLAHMALPLIGEGEVRIENQKTDASAIKLPPIQLGPKEGLALINGTQFSTAYASWAVMKGRRLLDQAIRIAALSMDVFGCRRTPLDPRVHAIRQQPGQINVAVQLLQHLNGSPLEKISGTSVQDPYSFRCIPQVLGASMDNLKFVEEVVEREINAVTDNPNVFYQDDEILEGGNFHAQPIALACDQLALAMAEIASIAERRIFILVSGMRDLPVYLTPEAGLQSGMMIVQYTAASVVSQNKQLCTPASIDSITSSKGQEDHVSMAANAATKLYRIIENVERVLAMELLVAMQALDFRRPLHSSESLEKWYNQYREMVSFADRDRPFFKDIARSVEFLNS